MAPAASTTDVCPSRARHGALLVRFVHVTPATNARHKPIAPNANTRARPHGRSGPNYKQRKSPPCHECARTAPQRTLALATHTRASNTRVREDALRWKCTSTHTCALTKARGHGHTHTHPGRTHTNARTHTNEHTHAHTTIDAATHTRACRRRRTAHVRMRTETDPHARMQTHTHTDPHRH
jgi:hypothetical protein